MYLKLEKKKKIQDLILQKTRFKKCLSVQHSQNICQRNIARRSM